MPTRFNFINYLKFNKTTSPTNILLHTGYDFKPWTSEFAIKTNYQYLLFQNYIDTSKYLNVKQLLIHGPDSIETLPFLSYTLSLLKYYNKNNINISIEMPAFTKSIYTSINKSDMLNFIRSYFNECVKYGFEIVIDTAHLYSNGLEVDDMIKILNEFKNNYTFIHLNGNEHDKYTKDKHTTFTKNNKIKDIDKLLKYVSKLNKICISEQKCNDMKYFKNIAEKYGFKLNDEKNIEKLII